MVVGINFFVFCACFRRFIWLVLFWFFESDILFLYDMFEFRFVRYFVFFLFFWYEWLAMFGVVACCVMVIFILWYIVCSSGFDSFICGGFVIIYIFRCGFWFVFGIWLCVCKFCIFLVWFLTWMMCVLFCDKFIICVCGVGEDLWCGILVRIEYVYSINEYLSFFWYIFFGRMCGVCVKQVDFYWYFDKGYMFS